MAADNQALNLLISHSFHLKDKHRTQQPMAAAAAAVATGKDLEQYEGALARFTSCMEDYLDDHKELAFTSGFLAPALFYLTQINDRPTLDGWGSE